MALRGRPGWPSVRGTASLSLASVLRGNVRRSRLLTPFAVTALHGLDHVPVAVDAHEDEFRLPANRAPHPADVLSHAGRSTHFPWLQSGRFANRSSGYVTGMSALQQPILMVCVMCGRDQFERPGSWTTIASSVYPNPVHLCEADAATFDPSVRYDPIAMERYSGVSSCRECGHRHYVMETGSNVFICASCGEAAPPLLCEVRRDLTTRDATYPSGSAGLSQAPSRPA